MNSVAAHLTVRHGGTLHGQLRVPGDKSISHRAVILGAIAEGETRIQGFLEGLDSLATVAAFRAMGVRIDGPTPDGRMLVHGVGLHGLRAAPQALNLGNSGTSMRLLAGLLAGQAFDSVLEGDASLSQRPMRRVTEPLTVMGARIETSAAGTSPLHIYGGRDLTAIDYQLPVASAQVKSAILLAGLYAHGTSCVTEPAPTRDHTERMLEAFAYNVRRQANRICINSGGVLHGTDLHIPADISSAAFFMVGAAISPGSDIVLKNVGINPTRTGVIDILRCMGADIELHNQTSLGAEPVADVQVRGGNLHGIHVPKDRVPLAIDEFPALMVAAAAAQGTTVLTGAAELRVKESDRIAAMVDGLTQLGISAEGRPDGMIVEGGTIHGGRIDSRGDHRIAMAFAMAALQSNGPLVISNCENVETSFPGFVPLARSAGLDIAAS